jgi:hypothetical protein
MPRVQLCATPQVTPHAFKVALCGGSHQIKLALTCHHSDDLMSQEFSQQSIIRLSHSVAGDIVDPAPEWESHAGFVRLFVLFEALAYSDHFVRQNCVAESSRQNIQVISK